jgi:hypothetical protein
MNASMQGVRVRKRRQRTQWSVRFNLNDTVVRKEGPRHERFTIVSIGRDQYGRTFKLESTGVSLKISEVALHEGFRHASRRRRAPL